MSNVNPPVVPLPQFSNPGTPDLRDAFNVLKKEIFLSLKCHHIGTIVSFDRDQQTAQATVNYKKTYYETNSAGVPVAILVDYPIAMDCPVICLGGGAKSLTFPIQKGDECLILFNDRDIDNWFQGSGNGAVSSSRLHSFSDGIIIVGVRSLANVLEDYDEQRAALKDNDGGATLGVNGALVAILNDDTTLKTLLQTLITNLNTLITQIAAITVTGVTPGVGVSGIPVNATAISAVSTDLNTLSTQIAGLLE